MPVKLSIYFALPLSLLFLNLHSTAQEKKKTDSLKTIQLPAAKIKGKESKKKFSREVTRNELDRVQSRTLGETLSRTPGIQNSYFGPNSGAPVIRSLSGNRVKILSNGLSINDLSGMSPNININIDMDNVLGIDVFMGNASVLYGGKAIGGAINIKDNTIPVALFPKIVSGKVVLEAGTNSGTRQAADINGNIGKKWAWHIGGMNQRNGNLKIPGNTKAPIAYDPGIDNLTETMAQVKVDKEIIRNLTLYPYISQFVLNNLNNPDFGLSEADLYTMQANSIIGGLPVANPTNEKYIAGQDPNTPFSTTVIKGIQDYAPVTKGIMPNSHAESRAIHIGTSYIGKNFYLGVGFRGLEGYYGIPGFALSSKAGHTHDAVTPELEYSPINTRSLSNAILFEALLKPEFAAVSSLKLNYLLQFADDRELVGIYQVNKFNTERQALRMEIEQGKWKFLTGTTGFDFSLIEMKGEGKLRYLPNNLSRESGVFTLQRFDLSPAHLNVGYRHDQVARKTLQDDTYKRSRGLSGGNLSARDFGLNHFTTDLLLDIFKAVYLKAGFTHAERAPDVNELYAGNDHFAIMVEENGDDRLNKEVSKTYELGAGLNYKGLKITTTHYQTVFQDYLYLAHTGISRSGGFLVKEWRASDTKIAGWETELAYKLSWGKDRAVEFSSFFDLVKNENTSDDRLRKWAEGDYMPNLPTSRCGLSGTIAMPKFDFYMAVDRYMKQHYLGKNINPEPPMPAYTLLAAKATYKTTFSGLGFEYYVSGNNLLNAEARPQNSFLKYLAPLPGRNISIGIKAIL